MNNSIKCIYYPYSRAINLNTLKKSILLFDEVAFVDVEPQFIRNEILSNVVPNENTKYELEVAYDYLKKEGVISIINPSEIINEYDSLLTINVVKDISDDKFCRSAINYNTDVWDIFKTRIPPSFFKKFYPGAGTFKEAISLQSIIRAGGDIDKLDSWSKEFSKLRWKGISEEDAWKYFSSQYKYVIGGDPFIERETYQFPFLQASSLRLNEALIISALNNYIPFTDSKIHNELLIRKVKMATESIEDDYNLKEYLEFNLPLNLPQQHLTLAVLDKLIPDEELNKRSLEELIYYRKENKEKLYRLREKIAEISAAIDITKQNSNYNLELQRLIDSKITPEITKTRDDLLIKYEETFGRIAIRSAQVTIPTLTATMLAGLSLSQILVSCAVAEIGMIATTSVNEVTKIWQTTRESNRTSFSYLTNV